MVQNAVFFAAKRKAKSINIHCNCINKTPSSHEIQGKMISKIQLIGNKQVTLFVKLNR